MINPEHYLQFKQIYKDYVHSLFVKVKNNKLIFGKDNKEIANYLYNSLPRDRLHLRSSILHQETRLHQFPISRSVTKGDIARLQRLTDAKNDLKDIDDQIQALKDYYLNNKISVPKIFSKLEVKAMFNGFIAGMRIKTNLNLAKIEESTRGDWKADLISIINSYGTEDSLIKFPRIENLTWEKVTITFFTEEIIQVSVGRERHNYNFFEIGFRDNRVRKYPKPINSWILLEEIAFKEGFISWKTSRLPININKNLKKYIQILRKLLISFIGISVDPFLPYDEMNKGWKTKFNISHRFED